MKRKQALEELPRLRGKFLTSPDVYRRLNAAAVPHKVHPELFKSETHTLVCYFQNRADCGSVCSVFSEVLNVLRQAAAANGCSSAPTVFPCSRSGNKVTVLSHLVRNDCGAQLKKQRANKMSATHHSGQGSVTEGLGKVKNLPKQVSVSPEQCFGSLASQLPRSPTSLLKFKMKVDKGTFSTEPESCGRYQATSSSAVQRTCHTLLI